MGGPRFDDIEGEVQEAQADAPVVRFDEIEEQDPEWFKRGANALIRGQGAMLGPLGLALPQFDVDPMEATSDAGVIARGGQQGASLGFADEDAGVRRAANRVLYDGAPISDAVREYVMGREAERNADDRAKAKNGAAFMGGEIAGSLLVPVPGAGALATGTRAARFAQSAKIGAGIGAASGLGRSGSDLTEGDIGGAVVDTTLGGVAGAAGGVVGEGVIQGAQKYAMPLVQKAAQGAKDWLGETAAMRALKASGYIGKDLKAQFRRDAGPLIDRGQALLDEGVVSAGASKATVAERAAAAQEKYGDAIGKVLDAADTTGSKFSMGSFVARARKEILDPLLGDPAVRPQAEQLAGLLDEYAALPVGTIGFKRANEMKGNLQETINWGNGWNDAKANIPNELKMKLQRIFLEEVDDQLGAAFGRQMGGAGARVRDVFKQIKIRYGHMADAADKARMGQARELGNGPVSATDYLAGLGGMAASAATGNLTPLAVAAGGAFANKVARERGSSTAAALTNRLSQSQMLQRLIATNPQALGRFSGPLIQASSAGADRLAATHFVLAQQEPDYREMMANLMDPP